MHGPSGANVSKLLPRTYWPPELRCAWRAETSLSAVMPPIAARAEARSARRICVPITSAISASKSVFGSSFGTTIASPGPVYELGSLQKTTGSVGMAEPVSSACRR